MLVELEPKEDLVIGKVLKLYEVGNGGFRVRKNLTGFVNETFIISVRARKLVLRRLSKSASLSHLQLETALLMYLEKKKFPLSPKIIKSKAGQPFVKYSGRYYTLQNFLPGQWKASWNNLSRFNEAMLLDYFKALARFSRATEGFKYPLQNNRPLFYYAKNGQKLFKQALAKLPSSAGKKLLQKQKERILEFIAATAREMAAAKYDRQPKQIVHFDFHPGNAHFQNNRVTGMFDFDWVRYDSRISDLASTICQSCYYYHGPQAGKYRKDRIWQGIKAYRKAYGKSEFKPRQEAQLTKMALKAYVFFQLLFCMVWYREYYKEKNGEFIIRHFVKVITLNNYQELFSE